MKLKCFIIILLVLVYSYSFGSDLPISDLYNIQTTQIQSPSLKVSDRTLLKQVARDTWHYLEGSVDKQTRLPVDQVNLNDPPIAGGYTSPSNIGLYLCSIISAYDLKIINKPEAVKKISECLDAVDKLETYRGFLYNWYDFRPQLRRQNDFVSFVDSGWFAMSLIMIRQTFSEELATRVTNKLNLMDFSFFYDPKEGQMWHGYYTEKHQFSEYHYGVFCTEARGPSLLAIGKDTVPQSHWFRMFRTLPLETSWQKQKPQGSWKTFQGTKYFQGYYQYNHQKIVPSWGGSMFEFLMPVLFIDEKKYAPASLGENDKRAVEIHIQESRLLSYPVWGMSPCAKPEGGYGEFGVDKIGMKESGYPSSVVSPHAAFLTLMIKPNESITNIRTLLKDYPVYQKGYGFYDGVNPINRQVAKQFLCLDQSMLLISINNHLNNGIMQKRFAHDSIGQKSLPLLKQERFFE